MSADKERVYKLSLPAVGGNKYVLIDIGNGPLADELATGEVGDIFRIEITEMTGDEIEALPEFDGW